MKSCTKCKLIKANSLFNKDSSRKHGLSDNCRECIRIKSKAYRAKSQDKIKAYTESQKNDFYTLYYLPEHHYIGITTQPSIRMRLHKSHGRHVLDMEVVDTFKTKREALDSEAYMQSIGYNVSNKIVI